MLCPSLKALTGSHALPFDRKTIDIEKSEALLIGSVNLLMALAATPSARTTSSDPSKPAMTATNGGAEAGGNDNAGASKRFVISFQ